MRKCIILNCLRTCSSAFKLQTFDDSFHSTFLKILSVEQFGFIALGWERFGKFSYAHPSSTCNISSIMISPEIHLLHLMNLH